MVTRRLTGSARALGAAFAVSVVLALGGCAAEPDVSDLSGKWVHRESGHTASLTLNVDGSASGSGIPRTVLFGPLPLSWGRTYAFEGSWQLKKDNQISLHLDSVTVDGVTKKSASETFLLTRSGGGETIIYYPLGDPDNEDPFDFRRTSSATNHDE